MSELYDRHRQRLDDAIHAVGERGHFAPFIESPSRKLHPEGAHERGRAAFEARLGNAFDLDQPQSGERVGDEISPYTRQPLGVDYPAVDAGTLMPAVDKAWTGWRRASTDTRLGVCLELLHRYSQDVFENAYATMHTAGQPFMTAFAGSGANALDRGLEALAHAAKALGDIPTTATFERRFGRGAPVVLDKHYRLIPRGPALVFSCASYPAWNAYPAIMANLATGNPVIVKAHPSCVLPMAMAVATGRTVLAEQGFDPNVLTLAAGTGDARIGRALLAHDDIAIIDFTGSASFGARLERDHAHRLVYTETAGCNAVVLESAADLDATLRAIATGLCLFSSQMCTSPQNIFIPKGGVRDGDRLVTAGEVKERLVAAVDALVDDGQTAAALCGAICSERTLDDVSSLQIAAESMWTLLRPSGGYSHAEFPAARTATPLLVGLAGDDRVIAQREHFGPMAFVIEADDREAALHMATTDATQCGAIASYAYTIDDAFADDVRDAFADAGASVGINLVRQSPMNFTAAYSDFHVTGLNPAGNACLTDLHFVTGRFRVVQSKTERPPPRGDDPEPT